MSPVSFVEHPIVFMRLGRRAIMSAGENRWWTSSRGVDHQTVTKPMTDDEAMAWLQGAS